MIEMVALHDWLTFVVRWAHIAAAIAWFGATFYLRGRALRLRPSPDLPKGAEAAEWQFHGGGYFHNVRYPAKPDGAPDRLPMFKWEAYFTWATGVGLLVLVYYTQARLFMIDENRLPLSPAAAITISALSLLAVWFVYDQLCKWMFHMAHWKLDSLLLALLILASWGYFQVFSGRAAMLHVAALLATLMVANVFFLVVPGGKRAMAALNAGTPPDPEDRARLTQHSRHIELLHMPVIALMASVHSPLLFGTSHAWAMPPLILGVGFLVPRAFERWHREKVMPVWPWLAAGLLVGAMIALAAAGRPVLPGAAPLSPKAAELSESTLFPEVYDIVQGRCTMCHAAETYWPGVPRAGKHVTLEHAPQVAEAAREIYLHSGLSTSMPPATPPS